MLKWFADLFKGKQDKDEVCEHCGAPSKYHPWTDCLQIRGAIQTLSKPTSPEAKAFYDRVGADKAHEVANKPDPFHGADRFSGPRGGGGARCSD